MEAMQIQTRRLFLQSIALGSMAVSVGVDLSANRLLNDAGPAILRSQCGQGN